MITSLQGTRSRRAVVLLGPVLAAPLLTGCGDPGPLKIAAIDVTPEQVDSVTFTASGRSATLKVIDGLFTPVSGATVQAATMLGNDTERYFPLNSYRIMEGVNQADPTYGFNRPNASVPECGAGCGISVTTTEGQTWKLTVGALTFNGGGFYAKVDGDPRTFLITKETVAGIVGEVQGNDFAFPAGEKFLRIDRELEGRDKDGRKKSEIPDYDPYLRQVLAAERADAAEKAGGSRGDLVLKAAASTQDQPGAKQNNKVQNDSAAIKPTGAQ